VTTITLFVLVAALLVSFIEARAAAHARGCSFRSPS